MSDRNRTTTHPHPKRVFIVDTKGVARIARKPERAGYPEHTPSRVERHRPAKVGTRLHMRALHLATVKQTGEGR